MPVLFDDHAAALALIVVVLRVVCDGLLGGFAGLLRLLLLFVDQVFFLVIGLVDKQAARNGVLVNQDGDRSPVKLAKVWPLLLGSANVCCCCCCIFVVCCVNPAPEIP